MTSAPSFRAQLTTRRTYNRPLNDEGTVFETWEQTVDRVIGHQRWLWERAQGKTLILDQEAELEELRSLMLDRKVSVSGRTLWLGGTDVAKAREASQFNCSFTKVEDVFDAVDCFWLLLQGCGVGFEPVAGTLNGFAQPVKVDVVRSVLTIADYEAGLKALDVNTEQFYEKNGQSVWRLTIGDSAAAWAKAAGKLLAMKTPVDKIVLDFQRVRAGGTRLKGYGWISSGDETISKAFSKIAEILSDRHGELLTEIDILDVMNWLGTTLSSRRSAEIAIMGSHHKAAEQFVLAKKDHYAKGHPQRAMSNNSVVFYNRPTKLELRGIFHLMEEAGGSEPGFINGHEALRRAPWFKGVNPCAEILLGNKSFCNLVEVDWGKFIGDFNALNRAIYIAARANYRQTCVHLKDGVLSETWHELNQFLRLCGVGATGIVKWLAHQGPSKAILEEDLETFRRSAVAGADEMADELGLPRAKAVTTVKPSGTLSKIMDTTEGAHKPLGKYIFNNMNFSKHDPLVALLQEAGYRTFENPYDPSGVIATIPVSYEDVVFDKVKIERPATDNFWRDDTVEVEVNQESAIAQLERYKLLMDNYVDHNCSITVSYDPTEVPAIVDWLYENWDHFVGVSWLYRNDPTKTAADLGYPYLPQEVVTKETYDAYVAGLKPIDLDAGNSFDELEQEACATGACPIR